MLNCRIESFAPPKVIAEHLRDLGMEVTTGVAKTGVVGLLKGALPGPVVALRADRRFACGRKDRSALRFDSAQRIQRGRR